MYRGRGFNNMPEPRVVYNPHHNPLNTTLRDVRSTGRFMDYLNGLN
jgi:hypothetical protein